MLPSILSFCIFFLHHTVAATAAPPPYTPTDYFLLNCGATATTNSSDGREWDTDDNSKFIPSNSAAISTASTASDQQPSVSQVPFMTARIFTSPFTYTFPVTPGPKFLRLYFYPASYASRNASQSFFSVASNAFSLLSNFSAMLTVSAVQPPTSTLVKEYVVTVENTQILSLTFTPSPSSYAFINGIELVSIPENLYIKGKDVDLPLVGHSSFYNIDNTTALETLYRLNVGGNYVAVNGDTGMFRPWYQDDPYIFSAATGFTPHRDVPIYYTAETPNYTAPEVVYTTSRTMGNFSALYNLTWYFPVDAGFYYLLRLHFCEIQLEIKEQNQRVFRIFINNQTAQEEADVIFWSGGSQIPVFKDYVVYVQGVHGGLSSKQDLWLAMQPNIDVHPLYADAILNGLEIFKLNNSDGSLAAPNPELELSPPPATAVATNKNGGKSHLVAIVASVVGTVFLLVTVLVFWIILRRKRVEHYTTSEAKSEWGNTSDTKSTKTTGSSSLPADRCRHFSLLEIKLATDEFNESFVIGSGGFGKVYRGCIDNGTTTTVAIKRSNPSSNQGVHEFQTEIGMLSKLRHLHLVSLIGYCDEDGEMILVYEYMTRGTLREHLYKSNNPPLSWKRRLEICIGAARGLHYLHTGTSRSIIHRDVKSTNILLDEKWVAKVADFGLSKLGPKDESRNHVSTVVKGSFGYVDPEYYRRQQLTDKSDVYSFGVVLFEVLCARPVIIPGLPKEQVSLAEWAKYCYRRDTLDHLVDANLKGEIAPECLRKFAEVAYSCLKEEGIERPTMNDVVWNLEFALQLQQASEKRGEAMVEGSEGLEHSLINHVEEATIATTTTDEGDVFSGSMENLKVGSSGTTSSTNSNADGFKSTTVFSELMNPTAR